MKACEACEACEVTALRGRISEVSASIYLKFSSFAHDVRALFKLSNYHVTK